MKPAVILSMVLAALQFALADDFKTIDGKEYKNATVSRVEPDGIVLRTKSGILKVYFVELPKEVQERFHYDAPKAATHSTDQNAVVSSVTPVPHVDSSASPTKWTYSEHQDNGARYNESGSGRIFEYCAFRIPVSGRNARCFTTTK